MNKEELLKLADSLKLPVEEYCIFSGGSLVIHGIRETTNDLDIDITKKGFEIIKNNYSPILIDESKNYIKLLMILNVF